MAVKTYTPNFDGYRWTLTISELQPNRGSTFETELAKFEAKLGGYPKELDL